MIIRVHVFVYGDVQGVFFRANTQAVAKRLGLLGWVRNLSDGSVEVIAEGTEEKINELIAFLHKGPKGALVKSVSVKKEKPSDEFDSFEIVY